MTYYDDSYIYISRWEADPTLTGGLFADSNTGLSLSGDHLTILDTWVGGLDSVTIMFADAASSDQASCKIVQFDLSSRQMRERSVSIFTDGSLQSVRAGTLFGSDGGMFGGQVYTIGY